MTKSISVVAVAVAAAAPAAALAATPSPPRPPAGFAFGRITDAKGSKFVVQGQAGVVGVVLGKTTTIVEDVSAKTSDLARGACVVVNGQKDKHGRIAADGVTIAAASGCTFQARGPRPGGQRRFGNGRRPPQGARRPAELTFVAGTVSSLKGSTLTVKARTGATTVLLSAKTRITKTTRVGTSAVKKGMCASVRGSADTSGLVVTARNVTLSKPGANGCSFGFGFGFRGGGGVNGRSA